MEGSLWRQGLGSEVAVELTHADAAYDYQPDVAPDGQSVVFSRYDGRAFELWRLDLASRREHALTADGGVNLEPRHLAGRASDRLGLYRGQRPLQSQDRRHHRRRTRERALSRRAAREQDRPLLLFHARSRDQSVVVAGRETRLLRHQRGDSLGYRLDLLGRRGRRTIRMPGPASVRDRPGPRGRKSRRTASESSSRATTAGSGTSSG